MIACFSLSDIVPGDADAVTHATPAEGNTESAALEIQRQTGGDLFRIRTEHPYPVPHQEASDQEARSNARPKLASSVYDMDRYDILCLGYPTWRYGEPMAVRSFLGGYSFAGKTIAPFCTPPGAGIERTRGPGPPRCP